ncbi:hypothetical protein [Hoeflea sp.]|uniref:hypothetical protein n=1 Tax=Hoeflea sp. TaxID=1940281 RepID=UPI003B023E03
MTDTDPKSAPKAAIIDPTYLETGGHHVASLQVLQKALHPHRVTIYTHRHSSPEIFDVLEEVRLEFATDQHRLTNQRVKRKASATRWRISQAVRKLSGKPGDVLDGTCYVRELETLFDRYGPMDHLVFPTTRADILASVLNVATRRRVQDLPHLHMRVLEFSTPPDLSLAIQNYGDLARLAAASDRVRIYTETDALRRHLSESYGIDHIGSAILQPPVSNSAPGRKVPTGTIKIGYVGGRLRRDKGYYRLPKIVSETIRRIADTPLEDRVRFVVQLSNQEESETLRQNLIALPGVSEDRLQFVTDDLDLQQFSSLIASCDAILLPYSADRKEMFVGSGILIDAVINGVPAICAPNDALTEFLTDENGAVADSDEAFAEAIVTIASDIETYKANAARASLKLVDAWCTNDLVTTVRQGLQTAPTHAQGVHRHERPRGQDQAPEAHT